MNTSNAESGIVPDGADPHGTNLIRGLVREYFAGTPSLGSLPFAAPNPAGPVVEQSLAGGYPQASTEAHPPVHPRLNPARSGIAESPQATPPPSGAHAPGSADSYAFGEPRCDAGALRQGESRSSPTSKSKSSEYPGHAGAHSPEAYYFLPAGAQAPSRGHGGVGAAAFGKTIPSAFDVEAVRQDFPALRQRVNGRPLVWLDNAATTHKPRAVIDATSNFYSKDNSNIHRAAHTLAARSTELFENGREKVRQFLGAADAKEIVFTRGTTEAINLVAQSYGRAHLKAGDEILLTRLEHHANIVPWQLLAEQTGAVIRVAPINDRGELILEQFAKLLNGRTRIVAVTHVSNALGTINPIEQIIPMAHALGVPVLVDGAQSTPHLPINVQALDADFFVFSGHKVFGPTGIGALYGKAAHLEAMPPWQGGGHMIRDVTFERTQYQHAPEKFEAGTPDIAGVVGLAAAIEYLFQVGIPAIAAYEHSLLEYATEALAGVPGLRPIGTAHHKASVLSFVLGGVPNDRIARYLDEQGIAVRAGHHCAQPAQRHFGLETTVRPSLAFYNNRSDVDALVEALHRLPRNQ